MTRKNRRYELPKEIFAVRFVFHVDIHHRDSAVGVPHSRPAAQLVKNLYSTDYSKT
jgi:hypothetical protein